MSRFFNKASQRLKQKIEHSVDRLRTSSRPSSTAPPTTSLQEASSSSSTPESGAPIGSPRVGPAIPGETTPTAIVTLPAPDAPTSIPAYARAPSPPTILATTGSAVKTLLTAARDGSDLFLPLKAALVGVLALWDVYNRTVEAKAEFMKLESRLAAFKAIADAHQDNPREMDQTLKTRLVNISKVVQGLWEAVEQKQARGGVARVAQSSIDIGDIKAFVDAISSLLEVFQFESSIEVEKRLGLIVKHLKRPHKVRKNILSYLGDNFVSDAADDEQPSYTGCMEGTRVGVLSKFITWVKEDPMAIFWLAGMAGTGKTSIAVSLCRMLREDPAVLFGGGYFCSRSAGSIARTDVRRILPTLAVLLADKSHEFAEALALELDKDQRVGHKPVGEQIGPLLRSPLAALGSSTRTIVFVIDALDECSDERELAELLKLIADFKCDANVKFILTSRPELHIRGTPISNSAHNTILHLHTIDVNEVTSDIRLYIRGRLRDAAPEATWYLDHDVELLVKLSGGLFIFASTVLRYVLHREDDEDRRERLHKATSVVATRTAATSAVDKVYELVLVDASRSDTVDDEELERTKSILACILTARTSLSVQALAILIDMKPRKLRGALERLHSLVYLPSDDTQPGLQTLHASFGDYLFERGPTHIRITAPLGHNLLARGCLKRMALNDLCFNVSQSLSSFKPNPKEAPDGIPLSLVYACLHWAHHVDSASPRSAFDVDIGRTFRSKFLFWLEVISVLGKSSLASGLLRIAGSAVKEPSVSQFLRDANVFVASSHGAISRSAPHIYLSALPFVAKDSLVYREFIPLCTGIVSVTTAGTDGRGSRLVATLTGHTDEIRSISYSPNGLLLASGAYDGTVRIWDTRTGEEVMSAFQPDDGKVHSVAFASDGQCVATGTSGGTVHIWSTLTGRAALPPMHGHSRWVVSVVYSPDGTLIASASYDRTVRLWNATTGLEVSLLRGHTDWVNALAFSPDGQLLASGSNDNSLRLWNVHTGKSDGDPLTSLEDGIQCLSISPDGKWLAAGSRNTWVVRVWNLATRELTPVLIRDHATVCSLTFSPDGLMLVVGGRSTIRCWDRLNGRELLRTSSFAGHSDCVMSVVFSPDGEFLASASCDSTIRIWDTSSRVESTVQPLPGHVGRLSSVAVSPDGSFIVSGSYDRSVGLWNAHTGQERCQPLLGHNGVVLAVAISSDGCLIASVSADCTSRLWDAHTGKSVGEPMRGHEDRVNAVAFSPNNRWLASGSSDMSVRLWDVATRTVAPFGPLKCIARVSSVVFSSNDRLFAAADYGGYIYIWHSGTEQPARTPLQANPVALCDLAFSPDSAQLVSGGKDRIVRVWDIVGGHQIFELEGHLGFVQSVRYSPDSRYIVSASDDKTVRLWDAQTEKTVLNLSGHGDWVESATFTPAGRSIVSGSDDGTIRVWDVEAALLLNQQAERDLIAKLGSARLDDDGWLMGSSDELLLWLPVEYRGRIQLPPCSMLISSYQARLTAHEFGNALRLGEQWTECWRQDAHPPVTPSPEY